MDESPKQLIKQTWNTIPRKVGIDASQDYEYAIRGVAHIFLANEPSKGKYFYQSIANQNKKAVGSFY